MTYIQTPYSSSYTINQHAIIPYDALGNMHLVHILGADQNNATVKSNYGEGAYSTSTYGGETQTGYLGKTGTNVLFFVTVSAVVLFLTLLAIVMRRPAK